MCVAGNVSLPQYYTHTHTLCDYVLRQRTCSCDVTSYWIHTNTHTHTAAHTLANTCTERLFWSVRFCFVVQSLYWICVWSQPAALLLRCHHTHTHSYRKVRPINFSNFGDQRQKCSPGTEQDEHIISRRNTVSEGGVGASFNIMTNHIGSSHLL